jgi:hypothetical protein
MYAIADCNSVDSIPDVLACLTNIPFLKTHASCSSNGHCDVIGLSPSHQLEISRHVFPHGNKQYVHRDYNTEQPPEIDVDPCLQPSRQRRDRQLLEIVT